MRYIIDFLLTYLLTMVVFLVKLELDASRRVSSVATISSIWLSSIVCLRSFYSHAFCNSILLPVSMTSLLCVRQARLESRDIMFSICLFIRPFVCLSVARFVNTIFWKRMKVKVNVKVWTLAIAPLTWVRLVTSSALQPRKWRLIGMSQWCRSALCGHPLQALTDNWTHGAASRHTIAPISHTRPSFRSRSYYSFPVLLCFGGCGLGVSRTRSQLRVRYSTTTPLHPLNEWTAFDVN